MENKQNEKQNIAIAEIRKDINWLKEKITCVERKVSNEIPHQIDELRKNLQDFKISNKSWLIGVLVSILFLLIGMILNLIK